VDQQAIVPAGYHDSANQAQANAEERLRQVELETENAAQDQEYSCRGSSSFQLHQTGYIDLPPLPRSESLAASNIDQYLAKKRKERAAKEDAVTIQRIVLGSTLATFGTGLDIQSIICGFENGLIEVKNIPSGASVEEITALFTEIPARSCVLDIRQYEDSSIIATVVVREDIKQRAADAITGKKIRNKAVTAKALKTAVGHAAPRHVLNISWEAGAPVSQDFYDVLKQRLKCLSGIMFFEISSGITYRAKGNAIASFTSATFAEKARKSLHRKRLSSDSISISCSLELHKPLTHALVVPLEQYHLHEIGNNILMHGAISPTSEVEGLSTQAKNLGYDWFDGWQWFCDATTRSSLASELRRQVPCLTPLRWDCMTRTLAIYTDSEANLGRASAVLESFANESKLTVFSERIDRSIEKSLLQSRRLEALERELGEGEVSFDVLRSQPVILYQGGKSFLSIRQFMEDVQSGLRTRDNGQNKACPVCLSELSAPVALVCGHEYCRPCLKRRILTSAEQNRLPIVCIGNGDSCKRPIAIPIIQSLLTPPHFQRLLDKVTQTYFNKRSDEYHNCITPDCTQVYRCSKEARYITCSSCNVSLCSACHSKAHSYLSCADWMVLGTPAEQERLVSRWMPNDKIKKCPECKARIEKDDGCNRVSCGVCGVHICWVCLASFNDLGITYIHLKAAHGGVYTEETLMRRLQAEEIAEAGMDAGSSAKGCIVM
ncbi:hypothetical protein JOM56_008989, partial [Amanita muscaria]